MTDRKTRFGPGYIGECINFLFGQPGYVSTSVSVPFGQTNFKSLKISNYSKSM